MLKLFYNAGSIALASHVALEETGVNYEGIKLNSAILEHTLPEYLAINPKGRVPSLVTEHGILTETPAILLYIAQRFGSDVFPPPADIFELAQLQSFNSYLCSTAHINHAHRMRGKRWVEEDDSHAIKAMQAKVAGNMQECFALIEAEMFKGPWVMGDDYSIADIYLFAITQWMEGDNVNINDFPALKKHRAAMLARPAVKYIVDKHAG